MRKNFIHLALSTMLLCGLGFSALELSTIETQAATVVKKKAATKRKTAAKKKTSATTASVVGNKEYKGRAYLYDNWQTVEIFFQPSDVFHMSLENEQGECMAEQGSYQVTGNEVSISYYDGDNKTIKLQIKDEGNTLFCDIPGCFFDLKMTNPKVW